MILSQLGWWRWPLSQVLQPEDLAKGIIKPPLAHLIFLALNPDHGDQKISA